MNGDPVILDLERFDDEFTPEGGIAPGPESLPDGEYDFVITAATLAKTATKGVPILRLTLQVIGGPLDGRSLERVSFLDKQKGVNRLGADLVTLGFDADTWNAAHGKKLSVELPAAVARLTGVTFSGKKVTSDDVDTNGKPYHNIYINSLVRLTDMPTRSEPPPKATQLAPAAPPKQSWEVPDEDDIFAQNRAAKPGYSDEDIPF